MPFKLASVIAGLMVMLSGPADNPFCGGDSESCTSGTKADMPLAVGVPEITPVLALRDKPAGNVPVAMLHDKGGIPPVACKGAL